jgi:hypothetical protein
MSFSSQFSVYNVLLTLGAVPLTTTSHQDFVLPTAVFFRNVPARCQRYIENVICNTVRCSTDSIYNSDILETF